MTNQTYDDLRLWDAIAHLYANLRQTTDMEDARDRVVNRLRRMASDLETGKVSPYGKDLQNYTVIK